MDEPTDLKPPVPAGFVEVTIDDIADYLKANVAEIDTFFILAFPKKGQTLNNLFHVRNPAEPERVPSFAFARAGEIEQAVEQFDSFIRIHMESMPQVIAISQQNARRRAAEAAVLVSPEGRPLLKGGH